MPERVFAVGIEIPGDAAEYVSFRSDKSLFDADVVIFRPTFDDYNARESYTGKPLVSESDSPKLVQDCAHWRSELQAAIDAGKVIFIILTRANSMLVYGVLQLRDASTLSEVRCSSARSRRGAPLRSGRLT